MQYLYLCKVWNKIAIKNSYEKMDREMGAVSLARLFVCLFHGWRGVTWRWKQIEDNQSAT
jgi:hypothetical protein